MAEVAVAEPPVVDQQARGRITGVDLARGIALLGMAATHMLAVQSQEDGQLTAVGWLAAGRASALFALLAGVSLALVTGGQAPRRGRDRVRAGVSITVRAVLIGGIGLWLAGTGTPVAVILAYYAVLFVFSLPFLGLRTEVLVVLAVGWAIVSPVLSHLWRQHLGEGPNDQVSFGTLFDDPVAALRELVVLGYYPVLTWMTYLLAGLAIGRSDLRSVRTAVRLLLIGVVTATAAWCASALIMAGGMVDHLLPAQPGAARVGWWVLMSTEGYGTTPTQDWGWLTMAAPHTGTPLDLIGTTGSAMAVLGLCLLAVRVDWFRVVSHPVAAAGSMTLTLYTVHVFALAQPWGEWDSVTYYLVHVVVALTFASLWLWWLPKGPMEWMVHRISAGVGTILVPPIATAPTSPRPPT